MKKDIFDYIDYKRYLAHILLHKPGKGFGFRSKIAQAIGCRIAYVPGGHLKLPHLWPLKFLQAGRSYC